MNSRFRIAGAAGKLSRRDLLPCGLAMAHMLAFCPGHGEAQDSLARQDFDDLYDREVDQAIVKGLAFLLSRQNSDGTFNSNQQGKWVGVCSLAGLALLSRGIRSGVGVPGQALRRIGEYVLSQVQSSGFLSATGQTSHGPMYDHGFGTLFLAEIYGTDIKLDIRPKLSAAVQLIIRTQHPAEGGWRYNPAPVEGDLSVTVCQMMALRAARNAGFDIPKQIIDNAVDYVRRSQNADGGYMYQLHGGESRFPLTAAAVVALYNAGIYIGPEIESAIKYLHAHASSNASPDRNSFFYYAHYYSAQAFWHRGGEEWKNWYLALKRSLLNLQNSQGGWSDQNSVEYGTAMACLILNMPRSVLPIFQR
ncbi:MAG: terpene cyclase/mutase family protein [Planctomycetales bacterium]|nr:terpene cyclase/mutase family protein [Planctomycetales bacterium]